MKTENLSIEIDPTVEVAGLDADGYVVKCE
jgi:hypothetical protein